MRAFEKIVFTKFAAYKKIKKLVSLKNDYDNTD